VRPGASVDLGTAAPIPAHLAVATRGRVLWSAPLSPESGTQNVVLPADVLPPGSHELLVAGGRATVASTVEMPGKGSRRQNVRAGHGKIVGVRSGFSPIAITRGEIR
jgi:hypothetical protein